MTIQICTERGREQILPAQNSRIRLLTCAVQKNSHEVRPLYRTTTVREWLLERILCREVISEAVKLVQMIVDEALKGKK